MNRAAFPTIPSPVGGQDNAGQAQYYISHSHVPAIGKNQPGYHKLTTIIPIRMKLRTQSLVLAIPLLLAVLLMPGCQPMAPSPQEAEAPDMAALEEEIALRTREFEDYLRRGDSIALGNMYLPDAEVLPAPAGREGIMRVYGQNIRAGITESSFQTTHLWGDDKLLVEQGTAQWGKADGEIVSRGRYLVVWQKVDGKWMLLRDMWFGDKD